MMIQSMRLFHGQPNTLALMADNTSKSLQRMSIGINMFAWMSCKRLFGISETIKLYS